MPSNLLRLSVSVLLSLVILAIPAPSAVTIASASPLQGKDTGEIKVGDSIKITLRKGGEIEGTVIEVDARLIRVKHRFGVADVRRDEIAAWERHQTNEEKFRERAGECRSPDDWCDLGDWANEAGERRLAEEAWREAIDLDPDNSRAREALGEVKLDGEWLPRDEAMRRQGYELYQGKWRTPEEIDDLKRQEQDALRARKMKGRIELEAEYTGRPWANIEPIKTEHYVIWCNSTEEVAREYADVMEALYRKYDEVFKEKYFPRNTRGKRSEVYIHANHRQFMDWNGVPLGIGGFYRPSLRDVTAYHGSFGSTGTTLEVLAHEGTHQFEGMIFKNLFYAPVWLFEGLAVYFGDGSEISRHSVKINKIPRDRLVGLKAAIENGTYCDLRRLLRLPQPMFTGFHYGHAWGVIFWCLYGYKHGARNKEPGQAIMTEFLIRCRDATTFCDYEKDARFFENLIVEHTGQSVEEWEEGYKQWVLSLPVEELGKRRGNRWISEALKLQVVKPTGWRWVKEDQLQRGEAIAARSGGSKSRRIATYSWPNMMHAQMSASYAETLLKNLFQDMEFQKEPEEKEVFGYPAIETVFTGARVQAGPANVGGGEQKDGKSAPDGAAESLRYHVVIYGSIDKIYANVLEVAPEMYEDTRSAFNKYLEAFHIDN
ncbi:MAG: hypothetical protein ACE5GW_07355 [Planctomycetota bacterium]